MRTLVVALAALLFVTGVSAKTDTSKTLKTIAELQAQLNTKDDVLRVEQAKRPVNTQLILNVTAEKVAIQENIQKELKKLPKNLRKQVEALQSGQQVAPAVVPVQLQTVVPGAKKADGISCEDYKDPHNKLVCYTAKRMEAENQEVAARKAMVKSEPKLMREARAKVEKEEAKATKERQNWERQTAWVREHAQVRGCAGPVIMMGNRQYHQVLPDDNRVYLSTDAYEHDSFFMHVVTVATNTADVPVDIMMNGKLVVENLCPGGSVTLNKRIEIAIGYTPVQYTAVGRSLGHGTRVSYGPSTTLDPNSTVMKQVLTWYISF